MDEMNEQFKKSAENYSLIPSAFVWENVEADIRKRKRKKRFIAFFFAGLLLSGLIGSSLYFAEKEKVTDAKKHAETISEKKVIEYLKEDEAVNTGSKLTKSKSTQTKKANNRTGDKIEGIAEEKQNAIKLKRITQYAYGTKKKKPETGFVFNPKQKKQNVSFINPGILMNPEKIDLLSFNLSEENYNTQPVLKKDSIREIQDEKPQLIKRKWSIALTLAPALNFSNIREKNNDTLISNYRNATDKNKSVFNFHLNIAYKILPEIEVYSGAGIITFKQEIKNKQAAPIVSTSSPGSMPLDFLENAKDSSAYKVNEITYLKIPVGISYKFAATNKFAIKISPEISFNKAIYANGFAYDDSTHTYTTLKVEKLRKWLPAYGIGLSFEYLLNEKVSLAFSQMYRSYQKSVFKESSVLQTFQQIEFGVSFRYNLK